MLEVAMVALSERSIAERRTEVSVDRGFVTANPVRRGPVVLAIDGTESGGSAVVAARMIAVRLDLPLEVVTVLEPARGPSAARNVGAPDDGSHDDIRRRTRETLVTDYVGRFSGGDTPARVHVRVGNVSDEVARFARAVSATTVVFGDGRATTPPAVPPINRLTAAR
jgi:hypothetical protein